MQYKDDVLQNCTPKTYIILLANVIPINSINKKKNLEVFKIQIGNQAKGEDDISHGDMQSDKIPGKRLRKTNI